MILFSRGALSVRRLEPQDAPLLVKWLSDPAVLEYYEGRDRPHDLDLVRAHFFADSEDGVTRGISSSRAGMRVTSSSIP